MNATTKTNPAKAVAARITLRAFLLGALFSGLFAWYSVYREQIVDNRILTATQIAVLPYLLLILCVVAVNPLFRLIRILRPFTAAELLIVFLMGSVSSGIATFGLGSQLVPILATLSNPNWNSAQSRWDLYIEPFVNDRFFIAAEGAQASAQQASQTEFAWRQTQDALNAARNLQTTRTEIDRLQAELAAEPDTPDAAGRRAKLGRTLAVTDSVRRQAETIWAALPPPAPPEAVLRDYPARLETLHAAMLTQRERHDALRTDAFAAISRFRQGLPKHQRTIPGFVPIVGERLDTYRYRVERLTRGTDALRDLEAVDTGISQSLATGAPGPAALAEAIHAATAKLDPLTNRLDLVTEQAELDTRSQALARDITSLNTDIGTLTRRTHYARGEELKELNERITTTTRDASQRIKAKLALDATIEHHISPQLDIVATVASVADRLTTLATRLTTANTAELPAIQLDLRQTMDRFASFDASRHRFWLGDVPWALWLPPLLRWTVIIFLTYLVLMTFNVLIFRQWAYHEKLIYPLAQLPEALGGADDDVHERIPAIFKSGMFWSGFAISAGVLSWNLLVARGSIPGASPIKLVFWWEDYVRDSLFSGWSGMRHEVFFTLVGLTFLIPARISYSLWFFHILNLLLLLVMVWLGFGVNRMSFPADLTMYLNYAYAIGGGALTVFAAVTLWKCRRYLLCAFSGKGVRNLDPDERKELRLSSALFLGGSVLLILALSYGLGANLYYTIFLFIVVLMMTIGLVRAVTEGGLLGFQCFFSPFHILRSTFGMDKTWTAGSLFAPLMIYYYILFWDIKAFIAPAMANALKVRDTLKMGRLRFHIAIFVGIATAFVIAIASHIITAYHQGADTMYGWFYSTAPKGMFDTIKSIATSPPVDPNNHAAWILTGIIAMGALLFFRQHIFGLPHPIGLIMWVNPMMRFYWFSIFLGWLFKSMVSKYGNASTYQRFKQLFIGLIVGELVMCLFGIDLNRQ